MPVYSSPYPLASLPRKSVYAHVVESERFASDSPAFLDGVSGQITTRATVKSNSSNLAHGLRNLQKFNGLELHRGSTVTIFSPNTVLYPIIMLATAAAGIRAAFANSSYTVNELAHVLRDSNSSHIIVHGDLLSIAVSALASIGVLHDEAKKRIVIISPRDTLPAKFSGAGWISYDSLVTGGPLPPEDFGDARSEETAYVYYSSGTTGLSKGVELSHFNTTSVVEQCTVAWSGYEHGRDVALGVIPFFHVFGGVIVLLYSYSTGIPVVILPRFDPVLFLSSIAKYKITAAMIVPPLLRFLAKHPLVEKYDLSSLRSLLIGAAPIGTVLIEEALQRLESQGAQISIGQGLGLTETCGSTHMMPIERSNEKDKFGTVGLLLSNMEARLVDENGKDVPEGEPGELWVRGPNVMKGYIGNQQANSETMTSDGWLKTGDVLTRDREGFYTVVDRKKELIKYKGFQVPPAELEAILTTDPDVADAGVVGIHSQNEATELPMAFIVPKDLAVLRQLDNTEFIATIHQWLQSRVANHKQLRGGIVLTETIPRSAAGKILRKTLRDTQRK